MILARSPRSEVANGQEEPAFSAQSLSKPRRRRARYRSFSMTSHYAAMPRVTSADRIIRGRPIESSSVASMMSPGCRSCNPSSALVHRNRHRDPSPFAVLTGPCPSTSLRSASSIQPDSRRGSLVETSFPIRCRPAGAEHRHIPSTLPDSQPLPASASRSHNHFFGVDEAQSVLLVPRPTLPALLQPVGVFN